MSREMRVNTSKEEKYIVSFGYLTKYNKKYSYLYMEKNMCFYHYNSNVKNYLDKKIKINKCIHNIPHFRETK